MGRAFLPVISPAWRGHLMRWFRTRLTNWCVVCLLALVGRAEQAPADAGLRIGWKDNYLTIRGPRLPGGQMNIHCLEASCRPGSTNRKWEQPLIGHKTRLVSAD